MITDENAIDNFRKAVESAEVMQEAITLHPTTARELLNEINELRVLAKTAAIQVGDVVRDVGGEEETGEVISVSEFHDEMVYRVKLFYPTRFTKEISYYEGEIEMVRRPQ